MSDLSCYLCARNIRDGSGVVLHKMKVCLQCVDVHDIDVLGGLRNSPLPRIDDEDDDDRTPTDINFSGLH